MTFYQTHRVGNFPVLVNDDQRRGQGQPLALHTQHIPVPLKGIENFEERHEH